ncbi:hypothetical protein [Fructobacillus tropaeoli]|uniref:hypothetical protein n=1 Tax=Fructobacillus tropaeoli TaxID=709323 RepID=UPI0013147EF4|nr:hypothetical protein [Fructobacillus tropaeoli]
MEPEKRKVQIAVNRDIHDTFSENDEWAEELFSFKALSATPQMPMVRSRGCDYFDIVNLIQTGLLSFINTIIIKLIYYAYLNHSSACVLALLHFDGL